MFRKILICTDLTPSSNGLVQCAEELKGVGMEEVILAHALSTASSVLTEDARQTLEQQVKMLRETGIRVSVEMPIGHAAASLAEAAERQDVSVVLISSHGKGMLQAATLGSVSTALLHQARRPVLLGRTELLEESKSPAVCREIFSRILFPTDFSETAEKALQYVAAIAKERKVPVTLLHVLGQQKMDPAEARSADEAARFLLDAKKARLEKAGATEVEIALATGTPEERIVEAAREGAFSLIVIGFKGKGMVREVLMGSVAHAVARHAAVPVLFIPAPD